MKTSANGLAFLASQEGEVLHPYQDVGGKWTVGVGHLLTADDHIPGLTCTAAGTWTGQITHQQALDLLAGDVANAERAIIGGLGKELGLLTQNAFDACVSLTFNIGIWAWSGSHVRQYILSGDLGSGSITYQEALEIALSQRATNAADAFCFWWEVDGVGNSGLLNRRMAERALFLRPVEMAVA